MNMTLEQVLITKIKALSPQQVAEVVDFVEFLAAKSAKRAALDRLLAIAPAIEATGVEPMTEDEIAAEVKAARADVQLISSAALLEELADVLTRSSPAKRLAAIGKTAQAVLADYV